MKNKNIVPKLTAFELATIFQSRIYLIKIDGDLHFLNGCYFQKLDPKSLETLILETLRAELHTMSSTKVQRVAYMASLLHVVQLYRNKTMTTKEKIQDFFQWTYDHLLVGEYLLVYATLLFSGEEGVKAPKHANSDDLSKIVAECENQAWDIAYLTNWSTLYSDTEKYAEEFLFATNDVLLKRIFIYKNRPYGLSGLLFDVLSKKEYKEITDYIDEKMRNRVKPDFGDDTHAYFQRLIDEEKGILSMGRT